MKNNIFKKSKYVKIASHEGHKGKIKKAVLLFSGGLDTSCMVKWIQDEYQCDLVALTIDLGQQLDDLPDVKKKALKLGAKKAYVLDCKDEFAQEYIARAIKANASYQGDYHLSTPLGRPLLAKKAVEIAHKEGADAIAHGCTGKGNDQVRIEATALCYDPNIKVIAPVREWGMCRDEEIRYAKKHNISIPESADKSQQCPYSADDNMWGITWEGGEIEDPKLKPKLDKILRVCTVPEKAPNKKEEVDGVGYTVLIEDRLVGLKVRGVYESPAAHVITMAHYNLEKLVSTQEENAFKEIIDSKWAYMCYCAKWLEPTMEHLNAYIDDMNQKVTGKVKLSLYKGKVEVMAVNSPNSLFDKDLATFDKNPKFNQNSSASFIEIYGLGMKTAHQIKKSSKN